MTLSSLLSTNSPSETDTMIFSDPLQLTSGIIVKILLIRFIVICSLPITENVNSGESISVADKITTDKESSEITKSANSPSIGGSFTANMLNGTSWLSSTPSLSATVTVIIPLPEELALPVRVKRLPFIDYSECVSNEGIQARFDTWNGFYFYETATDKSIILSEVKK